MPDQTETPESTAKVDNSEEIFEEPSDMPEEEGEGSTGETNPEEQELKSEQVDPEGSTEPEGESRSEDEDPASDPDADTDQQATSEQEGEEASESASDEDEDEDSPFFEGEHSVYESREDALEGIEEKDRYIMDLQSRLEETTDQASEEIDKLQSELEEVRQERDRYKSAVDDETVQNLAIQDYLPERFQGKTEADFADDQELQEFRKAKAKAEVELEREQERQQKQQEKLRNQIQKQHERAKEWVEENVKAEDFRATSPERQARLQQFLQKEEGEYTPLQKVQFVTAAFGEQDGKRFLQGLQSEFGDDSEIPTPKNGTEESQSASDEEVAEEVQTSKPKPDSPNPNPEVRENNMDDRTEMEEMFRRGTKDQNLF